MSMIEFKTFGEKVEHASYQHFLLFPKMFFTIPRTNLNFLVTFILLSASALNLNKSKIFSFGKELISQYI